MATLGQLLGAIPGIGDAANAISGGQPMPRQQPNTLGAFMNEPKTWQKVLGIIGDALTSYSGGRGSFIPYMQQQQQAQLEQQQAYDMAEREFQNRLAIEKYKRENPESPAMAKNFQWWQSLPEEAKQAFAQYQDVVQPNWVTGPDGQPYQRERDSGPVPIQISPEDWNSGTPLGDAGSNASGGF